MVRSITWTMAVAAAAVLFSVPAFAADDPLASWNDGATKTAIIEFVEKVTDEAGAGYVPPAERIATFDNDGTLWPSHPMYTHLAFALDRVKAMAPEHPEWAATQPCKAVIEGDMKTLAGLGEKGLVEIVAVTHAGMSTVDFEKIVTDWLSTARHPRFDRLYTDLAYEPMLELLAYLRANDFKVFIVSGGGIEFMRPWTEAVYGIPPEQVIGSSIKTEFKVENGTPVLMRLPSVDFIDDKAGKPVGIASHIGRRPIAAFGNSAGDREMLQWTGAGDGPHLMVLVLHDDADREYAYGPANGLPETHFGTFPQELMDEARKSGWLVISMKDDWNRIWKD